jgi:hypothetical protein
MSGIQQMLTGGTYKPAGPTTIGQAFGGGFYAGKIAVSGGDVATHYLIVAPKSTGEASRTWNVYGVSNFGSDIDGPTNTTLIAAAGSAAATFCKNLTIGGYTDWYLPAMNELEVLYYFLKPTTTSNNTSKGSNANAVSPEPISTDYTSGSPAQTSAGIGFRTGETNAFTTSGDYWTSTGFSSSVARAQSFSDGTQNLTNRNNSLNTRAVRRIPV